jgi:hypothetical protein
MSERTETFVVFVKYIAVIISVVAVALLSVEFSEVEARGWGTYGLLLATITFFIINLAWGVASSTVRNRIRQQEHKKTSSQSNTNI